MARVPIPCADRTSARPQRLRQCAAVLAVLTVTFPFFALVLCGYVATQARVLPLTAIGGLNSFVLFFALPCMLYRFGANTPIAQLLDPVVALIYLLCGLLVVAGAVAATVRRWGWNDAAFGAWSPRFPTRGLWACRCWWRYWGKPAPGR